MQSIVRSALTASLSLCLTAPVMGQEIDLSTIKPQCPTPYDPEPVDGKCVATKLSGLNKDQCEASTGLKFNADTCERKGEAPLPSCGTQLADLIYKNGKCMVDKSIPRSAPGHYIGDYFRIIAVNDAHGRVTYPQETWIKVLSQRKISEEDSELTVIALKRRPRLISWFDDPKEEGSRTVRASDLAEVGASRIGWTYGALALPFKYYTGDKRFKTNVSIGPYVGHRWGTPGSAFTFAGTAAIGSVTGEIRDASDKITSTPELLAFSLGAGFMWDLSKAPKIKPFKIGVFAGRDRVSNDDVVKFRNNDKTWISFQIGYDFTDN